MDTARAEDPGPGFLAEVLDRARPVDGLVLAVAPAALIGLQELSRADRAALAFDRAEPSLLTAFTAHYVHLEADHLHGNLAVYALVVPVVYLLFLLGGRRRAFLAVAVGVLAGLPLVLTGLGTAVIGRGIMAGFSGLSMAFVGVLPIALFGFLDDRLSSAVSVRDAPALFLAGVALVAVRAVPGREGWFIATGAAALAVHYGVRVAKGLERPVRPAAVAWLARGGYLELALVAPVVFGLAIWAGFPTDPAREGSVVDLLGHVLGYGLGFLVPYVGVLLAGGRRPPPPPPSEPPEASRTDDARPPDVFR